MARFMQRSTFKLFSQRSKSAINVDYLVRIGHFTNLFPRHSRRPLASVHVCTAMCTCVHLQVYVCTLPSVRRKVRGKRLAWLWFCTQIKPYEELNTINNAFENHVLHYRPNAAFFEKNKKLSILITWATNYQLLPLRSFRKKEQLRWNAVQKS